MKLGSLQEKKWVSVVTSREGCGLDRRASCRKTMVSGPLFNLHEYFLFKIFNYACAHTHTEWHQNPQAGWSYDSAVLSRAWGICIFSKLPTHPGDRSTANHTLRTLPAPLFLSWPKKLYIRFSALMAPLDTSKEAEAPGPFAARATLSRGLLVWTLHFTHAWTQDAQRAAIFDWEFYVVAVSLHFRLLNCAQCCRVAARAPVALVPTDTLILLFARATWSVKCPS